MTSLRIFLAVLLSSVIACTHTSKPLELPMANQTYRVKSSDGTDLFVKEWGNQQGKPIIFIHGWSQSHMIWFPQIISSRLKGFRLIALDLRGHGASEKPKNRSSYQNSKLWADDINAIIESLQLSEVTLVGHSYGSIIIGDYLKHYGESSISYIQLVGGLIGLNTSQTNPFIGKDYEAVNSSFVQEPYKRNMALITLTDRILLPSTSNRLYSLHVANATLTNALTKEALLSRKIDHSSVWSAVKIPVLISHGMKDSVIKLASSQRLHDIIPNALLSVYKEANHGPHWQNSRKFNQELALFLHQMTPDD